MSQVQDRAWQDGLLIASDHDFARRSDLAVGERELDADLTRLVHQTSVLRQGFYVVVLLVALAGQVSGAVEALHIPLAAAIPAVAALELGGIVVLANADVRRRLGERAVASRVLSVAIAAGAVTFNWLAHSNHLLGAFFAGMSALGYLVWLMHTENQRRDRLRVKGDLPPTTPAYEVVGHWARHPWLTSRARAMAKADPGLGLYASIAGARAEVRKERRQAAIAKVLHRKIRAAVDPKTADIAIAVYDLDEIAARLAARADYDGLTTLIAADLAPARLTGAAPPGKVTPPNMGATQPGGAPETASTLRESHPAVVASHEVTEHDSPPSAVSQALPEVSHSTDVVPDPFEGSDPQPALPPAPPAAPVAPGRAGRMTPSTAGVSPARTPVPRRPAPGDTGYLNELVQTPTSVGSAALVPLAVERELPKPGEREPVASLRSRVFAWLYANVPQGDPRDAAALVTSARTALGITAGTTEGDNVARHVRTWRKDVSEGRREQQEGRFLRSVPGRGDRQPGA